MALLGAPKGITAGNPPVMQQGLVDFEIKTVTKGQIASSCCA